MSKENKLYSSPFSVSYWKDACRECTNPRSLTLAAILCAFAIVIEKLQIPVVGGILFISFSFLAISLCSMLTGPVLAIFCGLLVDLVGFLIPVGASAGYPFFPGYTLTAVLTAVVFALFLYRARVNFLRIALSRALIDIFINTLLGSVWRMMTGGVQSYAYNVGISGVKNLGLLPIEVFLMCVFLRAMEKPLISLGWLPEESRLTFRKRDFLLLAVLALLGGVLLFFVVFRYSEVKQFFRGLFM